MLVLRYAFDEMGLHRVDLRVLEYNERAIAAYEKCGFVREGVEREGTGLAGHKVGQKEVEPPATAPDAACWWLFLLSEPD